MSGVRPTNINRTRPLTVDEGADTGTSGTDEIDWDTSPVGPGGASDVEFLDDLGDVVITAPADGDRLRYDGSQWVNSRMTWEPVFDGTGSAVLSGTGDPIRQEVTF